MSKAKKQHFVPQTYLRQFCRSANKLWVYDKSLSKAFPSDIADIATGKYFYDSQDPDAFLGDQSVEKMFSLIESGYQNSLSNLATNQWRLSDLSKEYFAMFFSFQLIRTQAVRKSLFQMKQSAKSQILAKGGAVEDLEILGLNDSELGEKEEHINFITHPNTYREIESDLKSRIWFVTDNMTDFDFYTSDHPFAIYVHRSVGIGAIEHYIPLTPKKGLHLFTRQHFSELTPLDYTVFPVKEKDIVRFCNSLQVTQSYRHIYHGVNHFRFVENIIRDVPHLKEIDHSKFNLDMFKKFG